MYKKYHPRLRFVFISLIITIVITTNFSQILANKSMENENLNFSEEEKICNGYTLVAPRVGEPVYLIDMDGKAIHNWSIHGFSAKMLPNGTIIGSREILEEHNNFARGGAIYKYVSEEDWNGNITWEFNNWSEGWARQHHDLFREGNPEYYSPVQTTNSEGNTLILARTKKTVNKSISWMPLGDGVIYEVNQNGTLTGFEWHASEHFNEMGFDKRAKIGIYLYPAWQGWLHLNTCSEIGENKWYEQGYNEFSPGNIITCSRHANFIAIINKTTGNIVWRIGPDYKEEPDNKLGKIIGPHNVHIIPKGLPGEGNMLLFDNGGIAGYDILGGFFYFPMRNIRFYSRIIEFNPITKEIVWEYKETGKGLSSIFGKNKFYSWVESSVQRLPNGNTLITEGTSGRVFEVTHEKEVVWEYYYEGPNKMYRDNFLYRAYRVPPEWIPGNPSNYTLWSSLYEN